MPTLKPRHAITETDTIAHALAVARQRWPGQPPSRLLNHLIEKGAQAVEHEEATQTAGHDRAVEALTQLAGYYPDGYLDEVREGWSE